MSSSEWAAKFTPDSVAKTFYWAAAPSDRGIIPNLDRQVSEELNTPGLDGTSWRKVFRQFLPFQLNTLEDATSDAAMLALVDSYTDAIDRFGTLVYKYRTTIRTWKRVKVVDCVPGGLGGPLFGYGASTGSLVTLRALWTLRLTQVSNG